MVGVRRGGEIPGEIYDILVKCLGYKGVICMYVVYVCSIVLYNIEYIYIYIYIYIYMHIASYYRLKLYIRTVHMYCLCYTDLIHT